MLLIAQEDEMLARGKLAICLKQLQLRKEEVEREMEAIRKKAKQSTLGPDSLSQQATEVSEQALVSSQVQLALNKVNSLLSEMPNSREIDWN
jgi:hypothetical protein